MKKPDSRERGVVVEVCLVRFNKASVLTAPTCSHRLPIEKEGKALDSSSLFFYSLADHAISALSTRLIWDG